ncbi:hydroxymethylglutaryl-CoA lyase [Streptomyces sp. NPDC050161]|uniref:hydroxymethylglutaryl-CoA lyase n=1 Tax=Streptomyces sp. NPDC050161 TaxID=3365604 RepID=UPI0037A52CAC
MPSPKAPATPRAWPVVRDVTLRDGLQLVSGVLPTAHKIRLAKLLLAAGIPSLEIGAVVRPDRVPQMADTVQVIEALTPEELERCWIWVPNLVGVRRALQAGARNLQFVLSVSDTHNRNNVGRSRQASLDDVPEAARLVGEAGGSLQLGLATAFSCPFEGPVVPDDTLGVLADQRVGAVTSFVICDTIGQAVGSEVTGLITAARQVVGDRWLIFHGHDTWGQGVANSLAALEAGADTVDGSLGGLGGCPFAPGASGNTALEDIVYALRPDWLDPSRFRELVLAGEDLLAALGEPQRSRAAEGARRSGRSHRWAVPGPAAAGGRAGVGR